MQTELIEYQSSGLTMQGFIARKPSEKPQPLIMIVHDWSGCREITHERAKFFAHQGFVGFAIDLYGKGKRGSDTDGNINQQLMQEVMQDRPVIVQRIQAALDCGLKLENINPNKIVVLGFCFGGLCALDFARSGADVAGVVSIHGVFMPPEIASHAKIIPKILALHGYADKMVTPDKLAGFQQEMTERGADWQVHVFGNTGHAFTNHKANDDAAGLKYNSAADAMTWGVVKDFTDLLFV